MARQIKDTIKYLGDHQIYSLLLFALYQLVGKDKKYSTLSELIYLLGREDFVKLCTFYGGKDIHIPTLTDLDRMLKALLLYSEVDIEGKDMNETMKKYDVGVRCIPCYEEIKECLKDFDYAPSRNFLKSDYSSDSGDK